MEGNGNGDTPTLHGPQPERGAERMKSEQEVIARAIHRADPGRQFDFDTDGVGWDGLDGALQDGYMRMAAAAVEAAQPPLPDHEGAVPQPTYPAELLEELAVTIALLATNRIPTGPGGERPLQALDRYMEEVGRDRSMIPDEVLTAFGELGG